MLYHFCNYTTNVIVVRFYLSSVCYIVLVMYFIYFVFSRFCYHYFLLTIFRHIYDVMPAYSMKLLYIVVVVVVVVVVILFQVKSLFLHLCWIVSSCFTYRILTLFCLFQNYVWFYMNVNLVLYFVS